jgi:sortase A
MVVGAWQFTLSDGVSAQAWLAQNLLHTAWVRTQAAGHHVKPWPWADTWPLARLSVPHLDVAEIVLTHAGEGMSAFALGHSNSSVLPGELGNSVLNIHHQETFISFLKKLKQGDQLVLESLGSGRWHYQVSAIYIVEQTDIHLVEPSLNRRLTLIGCYSSNDVEKGLRYVVIAEEVQRMA